MAGFFYPVMNQVLNRRLSDNILERTLYFTFTDIGRLRQLVQGNRVTVIVLDVSDHFFDVLHFL